MMQDFVILADDLSGAADCAASFVCSGFSAEVFLRPESIFAATVPVVSIDLNSRELAHEQAMSLTSQAISLVRSTQKTIWYRKIDSTMRGNIGHEVFATARALPGRKIILFAPAFPDTGRTTVQGRTFVNGLPLEQSDIWSNKFAVKSLADLFADIDIDIDFLALNAVHSGSIEILRKLKNVSRQSATVVICDAETNTDLSAIAEAGLRHREEVLFVGSAGLARQIAALSEIGSAPENDIAVGNKPILVVVGSMSQTSRAQFDRLAQTAGIDCLRIPASDLLSAQSMEVRHALKRAVVSGQDLAITIEPTESLGQSGNAVLTQSLGDVLRTFLKEFSALVVTGGETARGLLFEAGTSGLRMIGEIEPGVTLSITRGEMELPMVMKAGAFGNPATLLNAVQFLRKQKK
jgi:uncharacterized protein YgbK (DUF1537 family)